MKLELLLLSALSMVGCSAELATSAATSTSGYPVRTYVHDQRPADGGLTRVVVSAEAANAGKYTIEHSFRYWDHNAGKEVVERDVLVHGATCDFKRNSAGNETIVCIHDMTPADGLREVVTIEGNAARKYQVKKATSWYDQRTGKMSTKNEIIASNLQEETRN